MKGALFTGLIFLVFLALYFKFVHSKVMSAGKKKEEGSEEKGYGYDSEENYGYENGQDALDI